MPFLLQTFPEQRCHLVVIFNQENPHPSP